MPTDATTDADALDLPDLTGPIYLSVLDALHNALKPKTYFEIGTASGDTLALAKCASLAVDPAFNFKSADLLIPIMEKPKLLLFQMGSDEFFAEYDAAQLLGAPIDFAFLDGMHHCEFLLRDFINTEKSCKRNSVIALHDCWPVEAALTERDPGTEPRLAPHRQGWWMGDVWRTALLLKRLRPDLAIMALNAFATGLILISNLDPQSTILADRYDQNVETMLSWSISEVGISNLFDELQVEASENFMSSEQISARFQF